LKKVIDGLKEENERLKADLKDVVIQNETSEKLRKELDQIKKG
jgi:hypothetical protein